MKNLAKDPTRTFHVHQKTMAAALSRGLLAVVHSHPDGYSVPSEADMVGQINTAVPWGIVATDGVACSAPTWWGAGTPKEPLIGRSFKHGVTDCYALIKDYYALERGIALPEFPREWGWWEQGGNLFTEGFAPAGFVQIPADQAQPGDVWLAQIRSAVPNHGGILLENGLTLHQLGSPNKPIDETKPSVREPIFRYQGHITHWLRYAGGR
ncbi:NlpC/P60 family protein [compost metagenome]